MARMSCRKTHSTIPVLKSVAEQRTSMMTQLVAAREAPATNFTTTLFVYVHQ